MVGVVKDLQVFGGILPFLLFKSRSNSFWEHSKDGETRLSIKSRTEVYPYAALDDLQQSLTDIHLQCPTNFDRLSHSVLKAVYGQGHDPSIFRKKGTNSI